MNAGDTAWMLASSALVLLMAPGLAFFYGGMVRAKSVLNMMMMSFIAMAIVPVVSPFSDVATALPPARTRMRGWYGVPSAGRTSSIPGRI